MAGSAFADITSGFLLNLDGSTKDSGGVAADVYVTDVHLSFASAAEACPIVHDPSLGTKAPTSFSHSVISTDRLVQNAGDIFDDPPCDALIRSSPETAWPRTPCFRSRLSVRGPCPGRSELRWRPRRRDRMAGRLAPRIDPESQRAGRSSHPSGLDVRTGCRFGEIPLPGRLRTGPHQFQGELVCGNRNARSLPGDVTIVFSSRVLRLRGIAGVTIDRCRRRPAPFDPSPLDRFEFFRPEVTVDS